MALQCFVGSFAVPATGSKSVTGVGFQPKAVLFFANRKSADGATASAVSNLDMPMTLLGMAVSSSARGVTYTTDDFTGGNPTISATQCIRVESTTPAAVIYAADFTSMDADGFTVNFSTGVLNDLVNFVALGGSDLSNVFLKSYTSPTSTGANAQTGVGFKPDALILIGGRTDSEGFGVVSSATARGSNSSDFNSSVARYQRTDKAYVEYQGATKRLEADFTSFDSDGFTLNFSTVNASTSTLLALCLKGGQFKAGSFLQRTSNGNLVTTGVGFTPVGLLISSVLKTAATTVDTGRICKMMGAASGTAARGTTMYGDFNDGVAGLDRTKVYKSLADDGTPTVQASADLASFDADGFTLNFGVTDATARESIYLAFGSAAVVSGDTQEWRGCYPPARYRGDVNVFY